MLEADAEQCVVGEDALKVWLQDLMDRTIERLDGTHFDPPGPIRRVEAMIAPPGGSAAMYDSPPSEDFTRLGRTWYPTLGKTRFPLWGEWSIAHHEGVPGHHFQLATTKLLVDRIDRYRRLSIVSGNIEGWAQYAERFMDKIGAFTTPASASASSGRRLCEPCGSWSISACTLGLRIPADGRCEGAGGPWTPDLGRAFVLDRRRFPQDFLQGEMDRYLGWPGQAICSKLGERGWVDGRAAVESAADDAFELTGRRRGHPAQPT